MWISYLLVGMVRLLVGASPRYAVSMQTKVQRIYYANHSSHIDTLALWSAIPAAMRKQTRPVAARDYWGKTSLRRYLAQKGFNAILIDRTHEDVHSDPLAPLYESLSKGESLIIFPEGTRQVQVLPGPFKSGLYHLAVAFPDVELVPVYLENLNRSMPKGSMFPVPMICTVRFGPVLERIPGEGKESFLNRARQAVKELA